MTDVYDVAVIGAGAVGSAIARELARYDLNCVLLEAGPDVGAGTSKASTAIWHTGFDAKPGTLEASLLRRSYELFKTYMPQAGIPVERLGGLLVAWNAEQAEQLPVLLERARQNGIDDACLVSAANITDLEPHLRPGAFGGLFVPGESILCTFSIPIALATQAVQNGVALKLRFPVESITILPGNLKQLEGHAGQVKCRFLVNAAGLFADELNRQLGHDEFTVTPRRGELIVFDKLSRRLVRHIILPVPTAKTKGVLISPTVYGNVLVGPTAEDLNDKRLTATSEEGLALLWRKGKEILPTLMDEEVTATYAGLRAATEHSDYQIYLHPAQRYVCVGGIRSTGVSACLGIAEYVIQLLDEAGLWLKPKETFTEVSIPYIGEAGIRPYQDPERIAANRDFGEIVCHCEHVSLGEIVGAMRGPIPARSIDGLRRRTRASQGRCQGFNCHARLVSLLSRETGQPPETLLGLGDGHAARKK